MRSTKSRKSRLGVLAGILWLALFLLAPPCTVAMAAENRVADAGPGSEAGASSPKVVEPTAIVGIGTGIDNHAPERTLTLGLNDTLVVRLNGTGPLEASDWLLYLNGRAISDLAVDSSVAVDGQALAFRLARTDRNKDDWAVVLGSPEWARSMQVAVAKVTPDTPKLLRAAKAGGDVFIFKLVSAPRLLAAIVVTAALLWLLTPVARTSALLRDDLLPQIPVDYRCFSLGRCQMAFWFVLVAGTFIFLWVLLDATDTLTQQSLMLVGIAMTTVAFAIVANTAKSEALTKVDESLRQAGFSTADDILAKLKARDDKTANPPAASATQAEQDSYNAELGRLDADITAFKSLASSFLTETRDLGSARIKPARFVLDLVKDSAGPTLHRLQLVAWTLILGGVFVVGVYQTLIMPAFSTTLLGLMGVTSAGYVGFKYVEAT